MPQVRLVITLEDDGRVNINGPLRQKLLCIGLLEMAKETVQDYHKGQAAEQRIEIATSEMAAGLGDLKRG